MEIVVVTAAVGLLAWVLYPVSTDHHGTRPREAACLRNQRQIMQAMIMYADDYEGRMPLATAWNAHLVAYLRMTDADPDSAFRCPSAPRDRTDGYDYAYNPALAARDMCELEDPARSVALIEADVGQLVLRHHQGAHFGYADGHVKWSQPTRTPAGWVIEGHDGEILIPVGVQASPPKR
jgi:prepilin-type processing-associated H-X9-DG protein